MSKSGKKETLETAPTSLRQASLRAVDRASGDLRRGDFVLVRPDAGPALLIQASESATPESLARMARLTGVAPSLVLTRQRAAAIGLCEDIDGVVRLDPGEQLSADLVRRLCDPESAVEPDALDGLPCRTIAGNSRDGAVAVTRLAKLARLLPAAVIAPVERPLATDRLVAANDILSVSAFDIDHYERHAARSLQRVVEAEVPLAGAEKTRVIAFRPTDGGQENLAIVIGGHAGGSGGSESGDGIRDDRAPLVRLHSECFTGDLLGSLRCDCGQQLRGAISEIAREGAGALLYLAQEGRGIGLVNKLRAYRLQDDAFDTVDANVMLGYDADERLYQPAAEMLRQLGFDRVRLLTNNPDKVEQLTRCGIEVVERVPHAFPANGHNEFYLRTKKQRSGHLL